MWQTMILTAMVAMISYYSIEQAIATPAPAPALSSDLAKNMATYRQTVLDYLHSQHNFQGTYVPEEIIRAQLPSWYVVPQNAQSSLPWGNQICTDGTVVVFATQPLPISITNDLLKLSKNSVNVGESIGGAFIYSPALDAKLQKPSTDSTSAATDNTATNIITLSGCAPITAGRPVWITKLN